MTKAARQRRTHGPWVVGLLGAFIMLVAMTFVALIVETLRLPAELMMPMVLCGPLLGWALTTMGRPS